MRTVRTGELPSPHLEVVGLVAVRRVAEAIRRERGVDGLGQLEKRGLEAAAV